MNLREGLIIFIILFQSWVYSQDSSGTSEFLVTPEVMLGISAEANDFFPERDLQKQFILGLGRKNEFNEQHCHQNPNCFQRQF